MYNPAVGYCQGMGMVVGMMLMNMDDVVRLSRKMLSCWGCAETCPQN